jgi:hypothetical protein
MPGPVRGDRKRAQSPPCKAALAVTEYHIVTYEVGKDEVDRQFSSPIKPKLMQPSLQGKLPRRLGARNGVGFLVRSGGRAVITTLEQELMCP